MSNSGVTKSSSYDVFIYLLQRFACSCTHFQAISFSVNPQKVQVYHCKNTVTKNNKMQLIIMDIIQSYYTLSNKNNGAELMFLFNIGLSRLINKISLISFISPLNQDVEIIK